MTTEPTDPRLTLRPPVLAGLNLDEPEPAPRRPWWRTPLIWTVRLAMVAAGAAIMYAEGQRQPAPGVGFAIALSLIMAAVFIGARDDG